MDNYIRYLIIVGAIVIVITLILFYIMLSYSNTSNTWPPEEMSCPDYWKTTVDGDGDLLCEDIYHLTSRDDNSTSVTSDDVTPYRWGVDGPHTSTGVIERENIIDKDYKPNEGLWQTHCGKKIWSQNNGISWDGITNSQVQCTDSGQLVYLDDIYKTDTA
jgi:hypothetical protein